MYGEALLLEMLSDDDISFALQATGSQPGARLEALVATIRHDPEILSALLDDQRVFAALAADRENMVKVSPYFLFSVLLRQARRELRTRSFTAEWVSPRRRVPVFDARQVAAVLEDEGRVRYLADLLASFTAPRPSPEGEATGRLAARRFAEQCLEGLRRQREQANETEGFTLDRQLGDATLFLAGVFPDSAQGALELAAWEAESRLRYLQAARAPIARRCGLDEVLEGLADAVRLARKALNFVADRFLYPRREEWFRLGA